MWSRLGQYCGALLIIAGTCQAAKISGTISTTMMITEDSQLTGDVTCKVTGGPCINMAASHITLDLNGYTITGLADAQVGCSGAGTGTDSGIGSLNQMGIKVRGPGIVENFKGHGIVFSNVSALYNFGRYDRDQLLFGYFLNWQLVPQ